MKQPEIIPFTSHVGTNLWLNAAIKNGWETKVLLKERPLAEIRKGKVKYQILGEITSANGTPSTEISVNKYLSNLVLQDHVPYITHPKIFLITDLKDVDIQQMLDVYGKIVVKPVDLNDSLGVATGLTSIVEVRTAVEVIKKLGRDTVLIENHVNVVKEYRVVIWKGIPIDIVERIPAYVVGNGVLTIQELIDKKNSDLLQMFGHNLEGIKIDAELEQFLLKKNLSLSSVPATKEVVTVKKLSNISLGGVTRRVPLENLHPEYYDVFAKIYERTWLVYCGLDLIAKDISAQPNIADTAINELNGAPGPRTTFFADMMEERPFYGLTQILNKMEIDP